MNERLKKLRKALDLTQQEFADNIGIKRNSFANYETGRNTPIDAIILSICREYNVSEEWLRYGTGEMFQQSDVFSFDTFIQQNGATDVDIAFLKAYFSLDADIRTKAVSHFMTAFSDKDTASGSSTDITGNAT